MAHGGWGISRIKRSNTCHPEKPHYANGLCRGCYRHTDAFKATRRRYYLAHINQYQADTLRAKNTRSRDAARYGLTPAAVRAMHEQQQGRCAICGDPPKRKQLAIDHDHRGGRVRALLCHPCNMALGLFRDDPERLRKALDYLRAHLRHDPVRAEAAAASPA